MKNYVQAGNVLTLPAPYALASGSGAKVGSIFGVAAETVPAGGVVDLAVAGVFNLAKVSGDDFQIGDPIFWDDAARLATKASSGNARIGVVTGATEAFAGTVDVRLNGAF